MTFRTLSLREHGTGVSLAAWLLLVGALVLAAAGSANASSLTGDTFIVSVACYNNPICPAATSTNPVVEIVNNSFQVQNAGAGFNFLVYTGLSQPIYGVFTNYPQELDIEFTQLQNYSTASDIPAGGFLGLTIAASDPNGNAVQVLFSGTVGTTDGFTLSDITYASNQTAQLNFQGLTGTPGKFDAVLQLPDAAVPEPATWLLLTSGLLGLALLGKRHWATGN